MEYAKRFLALVLIVLGLVSISQVKDNKKASDDIKLVTYDTIDLVQRVKEQREYNKIHDTKEEVVEEVIIEVPRLVDKYYYRIGGNYFSAIYQIVDGSTSYDSAAHKWYGRIKIYRITNEADSYETPSDETIVISVTEGEVEYTRQKILRSLAKGDMTEIDEQFDGLLLSDD